MRRRSQPAILMLSVRDFHWWNVMTFLPFLSVVQIIKLSFSISKLNHSGFWQPRSAVHIEWVKFLLLSAVLGSLLTGFVSFWQWSLLMECAMYVYEYEHIYAVAAIDMHYMHHRPHALLTHRPKSSLENLYIGLAFGAVSRPFINLYTHVLEPRHYTRSRVSLCGLSKLAALSARRETIGFGKSPFGTFILSALRFVCRMDESEISLLRKACFLLFSNIFR